MSEEKEPPDRVEIGRRPHGLVLEELRRHRRAYFEEAGRPGASAGPYQAEVDQDAATRPIAGHDEVRGVNVEVENLVRVKVVEGIEEVEERLEVFFWRSLVLASGWATSQGRALDVFAGVEG